MILQFFRKCPLLFGAARHSYYFVGLRHVTWIVKMNLLSMCAKKILQFRLGMTFECMHKFEYVYWNINVTTLLKMRSIIVWYCNITTLCELLKNSNKHRFNLNSVIKVFCDNLMIRFFPNPKKLYQKRSLLKTRLKLAAIITNAFNLHNFFRIKEDRMKMKMKLFVSFWH